MEPSSDSSSPSGSAAVMDASLATFRRRSHVDRSMQPPPPPDNAGSSSSTSDREPPVPGAAAEPGLLARSDTYRQLITVLNESGSGPPKALLLLVPVAIVAGQLGLPAVAVFLLNVGALVPLAALSIFIVLVATRNAGVWGGLVRAVFGNVTEMMLSITALYCGEVRLVQQITIGSTLIYSLFVLGGSFLCASYKKRDAPFSKTRTAVMSSLVMVASFCLTIPTAMSISATEDVHARTLLLSHLTAIVLFLLFLAYLTFRFLTHGQLFPRNPNAPQFNPDSRTSTDLEDGRGALAAGPMALSIGFAVVLACTAVCANFLVRSTEDTVKTLHVTKSFIGLVVLPLTASIAKSIAIVRHARSDSGPVPGGMSRLDFAIRSIMINVLDTLLFILPLLVLLGWAIGQPMKLDFGLFESVIFLLAVIIMTYLVQHGKTTYFEGFMLMGTYSSVVIAFYVRPESVGSI